MALTVKPLNSDASFLLSFEPLLPEVAQGTVTPRPFTILLDPWLTGPSEIFHKAISVTTQKQAPCVQSLLELPEPDLVVISQYKSDHCNEATLRQLPARNSKTLILAEPAAAKLIRSWKHFDQSRVKTIPRWQDPRLTGKQAVLRIPVPAVAPGGHRGEVTIAFIPQKRDIAGLHAAIGITYRPPSTHNLVIHPRTGMHVLTPPTTPGALKTAFIDARRSLTASNGLLMPPSPPASSHSLRSYRSASSIAVSPTSPHPQGDSPLSQPRPVSFLYSSHVLNLGSAPASTQSLIKIPSTQSHCHPVSVIFSPHGISYSALEPYVTSHLVAEAALPLTALLHCMNSVDNPWWMGGNINSGAPAGAVIAAKLGARIWVGAHDGEKEIKGLATGLLKTKTFKKSEMRHVVAKASNADLSSASTLATPPQSPTRTTDLTNSADPSDMSSGTQILQLNSGEEVLVSGDGAMLWYPGAVEDEEEERMHVSNNPTQSPLAKNPLRNDKRKLKPDSPSRPTTWIRKEARLKARVSMSFLTTRLKM
ncbi:MBL fold metallo-hydrolase [Microdochium nivale]|nr:MBL fold metallo-hydrolase [Microdochium nivale]